MVQKESAPSRSVGFYDNAVGDRAFTAQDAKDIFDALLLGFAATFLRSAAKMRRQHDILHLAQHLRDGGFMRKYVEGGP